MPYKEGQRITIINRDGNGKPIIEGETILLCEVNNASNNYEHPLWRVRFDGKGEPVVLRTLYPHNHIDSITDKGGESCAR